MPRSKGAAARRRKAAAANKANAARATTADAPKKDIVAPRICPTLPPDVLAHIHERLGFLDRIYFAAAFSASCDADVFKPYAPWLLLPGKTTEDKFELFSIADRRAASLDPDEDLAMPDYLVLGSSRGWLATADKRGQIHLVNPLTGKHDKLPHISTMGLFLPSTHHRHFSLVIPDFLKARFGGAPPPYDHEWGPVGYNTLTMTDWQMRECFYRKVVLSTSPRPGSGNYAAMLIMQRTIGAPAFATSEHPGWRLAASRDGVEDAIHHDGRFYSVSYSGVVEVWEQDVDSGAYTSTVVAPRLCAEKEVNSSPSTCRKYLAAAPGGRLMVVLKYSEVIKERYEVDRWSCSFKVHVLGDDGQWKEATDIGDVALFVGVNNSLCLPTTNRPQIKSSRVYFTDDELGQTAQRNRSISTNYGRRDEPDLRAAGVYNLKDGTVKELFESVHTRYPPPVWILPSIP